MRKPNTFTEGDWASLNAIADALRELRSPFALYETDIHQWVSQQLTASGFSFQHEATIDKGCRIDFLVGSIGVEIKKGKPSPAAVLRQLERYAKCPALQGLILLTPNTLRVPEMVCGKPVIVIPLSRLWGLALP